MENKITLFNKMHNLHVTFGNENNPAVLLIMGNSCDAIMWPDIFCQSLAKRNYYVIRFDQRDTGLSSWIDFIEDPYTLMDMVDDAIGLLDALKIQKTHIVGYSTGGLIAQLLTVHFSQRVLSLILMMSSIDLTIKNDAFRGKDMSNSKLPPPKKEFIQAILQLNAVQTSSLPEKIKQVVENFRLANGSKSFYDDEFFNTRFERSLKMCVWEIEKSMLLKVIMD